MANSYNAGSKYFDIDSDVDEAGLATLKGSAPDSNDSVFVFNSATVTLAGANNLSLKKIYAGDNYAGTAGTKTGHCTIDKPGYTVTLHDTATNSGLDGEGSTSRYTIKGTLANPVTIKSNTANACGDGNVKSCPCDYQHVVFDSFFALYSSSIQRFYENVIMKNSTSTYTWIFYGEPGKFVDCGVEDAGAGTRRIHIINPVTEKGFNYLLANFKVINNGAAAASRLWYFDEPNGTTYYRAHRSSSSLSEGEIHEKIFQIAQVLLSLSL